METTSLPTNWLDCNTVSATNTFVPDGDITTGTYTVPWTDYSTNYIYPYYHHYAWWPSIEKIRLTMSDVEKLRAAAKKDATLKKVLKKIGPHIEVEVDF